MDIVQTGLAGLARAQKQLETTATRLARFPDSATRAGDDIVDLSVEAVALIQAKNVAETNIKLIETGKEMAKAMIDVMG